MAGSAPPASGTTNFDMIPPPSQPQIDSTLYDGDIWDSLRTPDQPNRHFSEVSGDLDGKAPLLHHTPLPLSEPESQSELGSLSDDTVEERFRVYRHTLRQEDSGPEEFPTDNPLDWVALSAMILGVVMGFSFLAACLVDFYQLPFYIGSLALFHFLEYFITARYNAPKVSHESFLFRNGYAYHAAHVVSLTESLVEFYFYPNLQNRPQIRLVSICGIAVMVVGQLARSLAMIHGATNFSHRIVQQKTQTHTLVTTGIYSWLRHPSYFGFFYWALGTQMLLFNPVGFAAFLAALWTFFNERITFEERFLVSFFGKDYEEYRNRVGTGIVGI